MPRVRAQAVAPSVVAHRLSELLLQFPSAVVDGISWTVLLRKYEERDSTHVELSTLGHESALSAAVALLWDVARVKGSPDAQNPILMIEDCVALTPRPGCMGSWPSLYRTLCEVVAAQGVWEQASSHSGHHVLLMSQLKPLLQAHWHAGIDEQWGYLNAKGASVKTKKMKHLVHAVIEWRDHYVHEHGSSKACKLSEALELELKLRPSNKHNDLVLCCSRPQETTSEAPSPVRASRLCQAWADVEDCDDECSITTDITDLDDPFEPPQPMRWAWDGTPSTTTCGTPMAASSMASGSSTPSQTSSAATAQVGYMPVFFSFNGIMSSAGSAFGDVCTIPTGTVQKLRTRFESGMTANAMPLVPPQLHWRK
jgi:hypothetical protein